MKNFGLLLIGVGFLLGSLSAVQTPAAENHVGWTAGPRGASWSADTIPITLCPIRAKAAASSFSAVSVLWWYAG